MVTFDIFRYFFFSVLELKDNEYEARRTEEAYEAYHSTIYGIRRWYKAYIVEDFSMYNKRLISFLMLHGPHSLMVRNGCVAPLHE